MIVFYHVLNYFLLVVWLQLKALKVAVPRSGFKSKASVPSSSHHMMAADPAVAKWGTGHGLFDAQLCSLSDLL